ncbi:MAG: His/Gly/Thr/Pro-type tRNA ligase C-terminal domain-containing protein [Ilumatobacteraceae bacterium]
MLLEHCAGAFPTWMAPLQARVLPVADAHEAARTSVTAAPRGCGSTWSIRAIQLGKRIRAAKLDKIPYVLVVGDDDVAHTTLGVNRAAATSSATCRSRSSSAG